MRDSEASGKKPVEAVEKLRAQRGKLERVSRHMTKDKKTGAVPKGFGVGVEQARRKTGIDILGEVPWGTHLCQFYQTKQDLIDILVPYFKQGLENNEFCMWVTAEPLNVKDAKAALKEKVKNLDDYIKKGQIEILDYGEWYTKSGKFEADGVLQGWIQKYDDVIKRGFDGLRLTGNTFWLEKRDWKEFTKYEESVNNIIGKYKMLAICTYSLDKCGAGEVIDVVNNHQFVTVKREGIWKILESADRRKMDEALQESERELSITLDATTSGIYKWNFKTNVLFFSPRYYTMLGYDPGEFPATYEAWKSLIHPDDLAGALRVSEDYMASKPDRYENEFRMRIKAGGYCWIHAQSTVVERDERGNAVRIIGNHENITERKKMEAEARDAQQKLIEQQCYEKEHVKAELAKLRDELVRTTRLAAIGQVSASIAHDLRNPLGTVRNASYFLRRRLSKDEPKASEHLKIIDQEVAKADQIITNLLEMAQPKALHKQVVDLAEIVKQVFGQAKGLEGVRCRTLLVPDPFMVKSDPNQLRQAISNITSNAVYAMKGHGEFLVEATRDSDYDTLIFRDTGSGFAPEVKWKLFEPLITTKASGTGLGLTICRQIVEKHGGTIHAEDCKGSGAVIRIRLPRQ